MYFSLETFIQKSKVYTKFSLVTQET